MNLTDLAQKAKIYLLEVGLKRLGPAAFASLVSAAFALLAAHQGLLESWGITFGTWPLKWASGQEPSGQVLLIEFDTLTKAGLAALLALVGMLAAGTAHHSAAAIDKATEASAETPPSGK